MAKQPGYMLYDDSMTLLQRLSDEQAGRVIKAACLYFQTGEITELDLAEDMAFTLIKQQINRGAEKYSDICRKRSEAGKRGNKIRWANDSKCDNDIANANKCEQMVASVANITEHNITEHNITEHNINNNIGTHTKRPTADDVRAYAAEKGYTIDADRFIDHYTANGWKVGRNPMKNWKAAVNNWVRSEYNKGQSTSNNPMEYRQLADDELPF